ncbi:MAG: DUF3987 domain-containing protein [Alphaproteobacteria bacterium]|nr:DUF3987 domain-containing protein [Alphaproteobacteria bacterium]
MLPEAFHRQVSENNWRSPDLSVVDQRRGPVPAVPLEWLPQPWRNWIADTGRATGAPADYVLQSVLAGVAAVCGAGVAVRVTPDWEEPLVLWQAVVGEPATGKSAALAPLRRLLTIVERERCGGPSAPPPVQLVATDDDPAVLAEIVRANRRGVLLWRDGAPRWPDSGGQEEETLAPLAVSILETVRPERLQEALKVRHDSLAARFLFAWPGPQPYRALALFDAARNQAILHRLRTLSHLAGTADSPRVLTIDDGGRDALDGVLASLHAARQSVEGLEAAWLGRSRSLIVRLAGILELMASVDGDAARPVAVGAEPVAAAAALWRDYFWPHAKAVFDSAELSDFSKRVRRVARWLLDKRPASVSREEVRRRALSMSATADETEMVLQRLAYLGFVKVDLGDRNRPGRPSSHWRVNPALPETPNPVAKLA